jgi:ribosome-associated protein YbcJ (S4-like RNA binding protein)
MGKGRAEKPYFRDHMEAGRRPAANEPVMNPIKAAKIERTKKANAKAEKAANPGKPAFIGKPAFAGKPGQPAKLGQPGQPGKPANKPNTGKKAQRAKHAKDARSLDGEGRPYMTLVQFLKTIQAVSTGGAGKHAVRAGGILVNGSAEIRPSRKLHAGDKVTFAGKEHTVSLT